MNDARRLSRALADAIAARDIRAIERIFHAEATVWHNSDGITLDRREAIDGISGFFEAASQCGYADIRVLETKTGFVEQHVAEMRFGDDAPLLRVPCCLVVTVRDGMIAAIEEYLDTAAFAQASD